MAGALLRVHFCVLTSSWAASQNAALRCQACVLRAVRSCRALGQVGSRPTSVSYSSGWGSGGTWAHGQNYSEFPPFAVPGQGGVQPGCLPGAHPAASRPAGQASCHSLAALLGAQAHSRSGLDPGQVQPEHHLVQLGSYSSTATAPTRTTDLVSPSCFSRGHPMTVRSLRRCGLTPRTPARLQSTGSPPARGPHILLRPRTPTPDPKGCWPLWEASIDPTAIYTLT